MNKTSNRATALTLSSGSLQAGPYEVAWAARPCGRAVSEDFFDFAAPPSGNESENGFALAIADGLSAPGNRGRTAAEICVRTVLSDYMATSPAFTPAQTLERSARAVNSWLFSANAHGADAGNMLCTFTALAFRDGAAHYAHIGDSRLYRIRAGRRELLTTDHVWPCSGMKHVLRRAMGLDRHLVLDCSSDRVISGDIFMLLTDGVWEVIGEAGISETLAGAQSMQAVAGGLIARSIELQQSYMGRNDATAILVKAAN